MKRILILLTFELFVAKLNAQNLYSLEEFKLIKTADDVINKKYFSIGKGNYKLFKKRILPSFSLNTSFPGYSRSITSVLQPNGTYAFRESNSASSNISLSIDQLIPFTGGRVSVSNSINRLDVFLDNGHKTSYSGNWLSLNISQPLNFYNSYKWEKKAAKKKFELDQINYWRKEIEINGEMIKLFFDLKKIHQKLKITNEQLERNKKIYERLKNLIGAGRNYHLDSIELKLNIIRLRQDYFNYKKGLGLKIEQVNNTIENNQLKINRNDRLKTPNFNFQLKEIDFFIRKFLEIYRITQGFELIHHKKKIKQLKANEHYTANLNLGFGYNNSSESYKDVFHKPNQRQNISLSISIPIVDFGRTKLKIKNAVAQKEIKKLELHEHKKSSILRIKFLFKKIKNFQKNICYENSRIRLLFMKIQRQQELLKYNRVSVTDLNKTEIAYKNASYSKLEMIATIYQLLNELRNLTLIKNPFK